MCYCCLNVFHVITTNSLLRSSLSVASSLVHFRWRTRVLINLIIYQAKKKYKFWSSNGRNEVEEKLIRACKHSHGKNIHICLFNYLTLIDCEGVNIQLWRISWLIQLSSRPTQRVTLIFTYNLFISFITHLNPTISCLILLCDIHKSRISISMHKLWMEIN
jgi:hypothetical protein